MARPWLGRQGGSEGKDCGGSAAVQAWGQRGVRTMTAAVLDPYRVEAFNTAKASENKIHDDEVAKKFGFGGGLVPGVDVYAYMSHQPIERWGRAWLEHGTAECRFSKPVYDGDRVTVNAGESDDGIDIKLESRGVLCATGSAALPAPA